MAAGEAELDEPVIGEFEGGEDSGVGGGADAVDEGVAEGVVAGSQWGLNAGDGGEASYADVHSLA